MDLILYAPLTVLSFGMAALMPYLIRCSPRQKYPKFASIVGQSHCLLFGAISASKVLLAMNLLSADAQLRTAYWLRPFDSVVLVALCLFGLLQYEKKVGAGATVKVPSKSISGRL